MPFSRTLVIAVSLAFLSSCDKGDCGCVTPPRNEAAEGTWILAGDTLHAAGRPAWSREGALHIYTFRAAHPSGRFSTLQLRFHGDPQGISSFMVVAPEAVGSESAVSIMAVRGGDSAVFVSRETGAQLWSYENTSGRMTWLADGMGLASGADTARLSLFLSE